MPVAQEFLRCMWDDAAVCARVAKDQSVVAAPRGSSSRRESGVRGRGRLRPSKLWPRMELSARGSARLCRDDQGLGSLEPQRLGVHGRLEVRERLAASC
jgi:hypothetical protein